MKKIIIVAVLAFCVAAIASCAKPQETAEPTKETQSTLEETQTPSPEITPEPTPEPTATPTPRPVYQGEWEKLYGGRIRDSAYKAIINADGDYVLAGATNSDDKFIEGTNKNPAAGDWGEPTQDVLLLKLDVNGEIIAKEAHGGTGIEYTSDIEQTPDGGYIISGRSTSLDEPFSVNSGGYFDIFLMKVDADFKLTWVTAIGGSGGDESTGIEIMEDGSYLLAGYTSSRDGDIESGHGYDNADCLLAKVSKDGEIEWLKTFGGTGGDVINCLVKTSDGGWIACGYTSSTDGDFTDIGIHEGLKMGAFEYVQTNDVVVIKLDASGETEWIKCIGGKHDDEAKSIIELPDGGYVLIGETVSGDVKGYHSAKNKYGLFITDIMAARLNAEGDIVWLKAIGGKERDTSDALAASGGDIYIAGETRSGDGDIKGYHESRSAFDDTIYMPDIWLTVLAGDGTLKASGCIGGNDIDSSSDILLLEDGGFLFVGGTNSGDGDMEGLGHAYPGYPDIYVFRADPGWVPGQ